MALISLLTNHSSKLSILSLTFRFIPLISSRSFSSQCKKPSTPSILPPQSPPVPKKVPFSVTAHGRTLQDPYHWMRNTNDPDFLNYLDQENSYAQAFMADTENLRRVLVNEMKSRLPKEVSTPPESWGPWLYYEYIPNGKEYPVLCRRMKAGETGWLKTALNYISGQFESDQILIDWNEIAEQYDYVHVGTCRVSPDHNYLAYTLDITGSENFMLQIKDLRTRSIIPRSLVEGVVSLAWAQDSSTLFYTISDECQRPYRVLCTKLGSDEIDDITVFTESDSNFCVDITSTKDGKFITVNSNARTSSEVYVIDATNPLSGSQRIRSRVSGVQYFVEHHRGLFYILTNAPLHGRDEKLAENFYLVRCPVEHIQSDNWQIAILPSEDMAFHDMDIFDGHLVLSVNKNGFPMLCSIDLPIEFESKVTKKFDIETRDPWFFPMPSNLCSVIPGSNHDFMGSVYRAVLSSPVMPDVIVDYDMSKRKFSIVHQEEVRGIAGRSGKCSGVHKADASEHGELQGDDGKKEWNIILKEWRDFSDDYCCERKEIVSHDGVRVPLTILYSREAWKNGQSPGLLQGYGAYGEMLEKSWCLDRLSLLDRGWVLAFSDVRGGGGSDSAWHKSGTGLSKLNSILDFISCGNFLVNEGYVHKSRLCALGQSAGGLLAAAAINSDTDLFRAAILKVPFLDICNTLLDPTLPLTILDYEEFGNPQIPSQFENIMKYSPYDNVPRSGCYPAVLATASFNDSRVGVWEAAKWVARLRDGLCSSCSRSVILKANMTGGHFGEGGSYAREETAYDYAFLLKVNGDINDNQ